MIIRKTMGEIIRDARVLKGISLRTLAKQLEITPSYMSDIENDRRIPAEALLRQMSAHLALNFDDLMAYAGRFGEEAERYLREQPTAVKLFRRLSEKNYTDEQLRELLSDIEAD